nr:xylulose kinase-1 [Tanacetum cinerariifolium]
MTLTFAETHNMVIYLSKSDASEGFNQIIDFLNRSSIKYALTVNPNIYVSYIKQFWTTVAVKKVNDVIRLQALVDKKKVLVTEVTILEALRLDNAEGVECLPNEEIFAELPEWATRSHPPSLRFTKHSSQASGKQQVAEEGDAEVHGEEVNTSDTVEGDVTAAHGEVPTTDEEPSIPSPTPPTPPPQPSHDIPSTSQVQPTPPQSPQVQPSLPQPKPQPQPQQDAGIPMNLFQEVMDSCAALTRRIEHLEFDKVAQALEITKLKRRVKKLERRNKVKVLKLRRRMIAKMNQDADVVLEDDKEVADEAKEVAEDAKLITKVDTAANETITTASINITAAEAQVPTITLTVAPARVAAAPSKRRKGVVIRDPEEESITSTIIPTKTKSNDKAIDHVKRKAKEDHVVKRYQMLKRKPQTEAQARKNMMTEEEESRALKRINETLAKKAAKRQKLDKEVEELKRHLQIVPNEDDDVYIEATPLARKIPVVDYQIIKLNNKPYFKIIRADDIHQLYKNQRSVYGPAKLKGWKLLESCGIQIITFTTTQLILLVERKYLLTRFTLDQMMNALRLKVKEESNVSLELLRFTRQQHQEGQLE